MKRTDGRWWVVPKPRPAAPVRLFCFPYAGGSATVFRPWVAELQEDFEIQALQLPGRASRLTEQPFTRLDDLLPPLIESMSGMLDKPFAFFGHSLGAVLSFESVRWLRRQGWPLPMHLFVSGRRAPQVPATAPPNYCKSDEELLSSLGEMNGTPPEVLRNPELLGLILPAVRADFELVETYAYTEEAPVPCSITVLAGSADPETEQAQLDAWRVHTTAAFSIHVLPGDHFFLLSSTRELISLLSAELAGSFKTRRAP